MRTIDALIARHNAAADQVEKIAEEDGRDSVLLPAHADLAASVNAILNHRPSTLDEARRQSRYLLDLWQRGEDDFGADEMRRLLRVT